MANQAMMVSLESSRILLRFVLWRFEKSVLCPENFPSVLVLGDVLFQKFWKWQGVHLCNFEGLKYVGIFPYLWV